MEPNKFTGKTKEALARAHDLTKEAECTSLHLAVALISAHSDIFWKAIINVCGVESTTNSVERVFNHAMMELSSKVGTSCLYPVLKLSLRNETIKVREFQARVELVKVIEKAKSF
ncbi:Chaperone protein ClpB1 [Camellia lanceoleosa]|uniref:Chaperone protein ClpB1 n=1 Tax=Camellia lanceoleosa TaxID=1840588 RepID=A0ACC0HVP9_9ERIC|nr:Chaperone protein ClpB1 [Camellia lanceoleosa]